MSNDNGNVVVVKWTPQQVVLATLYVVGLLVTLLLLFRFRIVLLMLFVAILVGTAMKPGVYFLAARGLTRTQGQILLYALLVVLFLGFVLPWLLHLSSSSPPPSRTCCAPITTMHASLW